MPRLCGVAAISTACLLGAVGAASAAGPAKAIGGQRSLAVSVPPDPVPGRPGALVRTLIRIVNPGRAPVIVTVRSRTLFVGDDGKASIGSAPDPRWARRVSFPRREVRVPGLGYRDVPLTVRVPRRLPPDLYFVGFLVTPIASAGGSIKVVNQIGSFLTIDVPGPRLRKLVAHLDLPTFVLGSGVNGSLRVTNTGRAAVRFWGENDVTSTAGGAVRQVRLDPALLPAGRSRSVTVSGAPRWPVGIVTVTTHLTYPGRTESATKELTFTRRVVVVSPWAAAALAALLPLVLAVAALALRRRRRRAVGGAPAWPVVSGG